MLLLPISVQFARFVPLLQRKQVLKYVIAQVAGHFINFFYISYAAIFSWENLYHLVFSELIALGHVNAANIINYDMYDITNYCAVLHAF